MSNAIYEQNRLGDLSRFDEEFRAETIEERPEFVAVPDGKYNVVVDDVRLNQSLTNGNPRLQWRLRITGPAMEGRTVGKTSGITNNSLRFVKQELHICGLDPEPFSDLPNLLDRLIGLELEITKRTRDGFENIYFERRINADA